MSVSDRNQSSWKNRLTAWVRLKLLEHDLRASERFQRFCVQNGCQNLAQLERIYQEQLARKIEGLKSAPVRGFGE